jgi:hypothetical protein
VSQRPVDVAEFYAEERTAIDATGLMATSWTQAEHHAWAATAPPSETKAELIRRLTTLLHDPRLTVAKRAQFYADFAMRTNERGVFLGGSDPQSRAIPVHERHRQWALHAPVAAVLDELVDRIEALYRNATAERG